MKKLPIVIVVVVVVAIVAGVGIYLAIPQAQVWDFRVAAVLPEEITDMDWTQPMYETLMRLRQEKPDWDIAYVERIYEPSTAAQYFRSYADQGYNLIIAHGSQFPESAAEVARDFPNQMFWVSGGAPVENPPPNYFSLNLREDEAGYIDGVLAALMTQTKHVGFIDGMDVGTITLCKLGYEQGVHSIDPDIQVDIAFTGNFSDALTSKELALSMADAGADIILPMAGAHCEGAISAAKETGMYVVYEGWDKTPLAPNNVLFGTYWDWEPMIMRMYNVYKEGRFPTEDEIKASLGSGDEKLGPFSSLVPEDVKTRTLEVFDDLVAGRIHIETPF